MELNLLSIIFLILGLFVGAIIVIVTYMIRKKNLAIKAADMISEAVRKAEEAKNNSLAEIKAESLRDREETDKEIKERKQELKEYSSNFLPIPLFLYLESTYKAYTSAYLSL